MNMFRKVKGFFNNITEKQQNIICSVSGIIFALIMAKLCEIVGIWLSEIFFL